MHQRDLTPGPDPAAFLWATGIEDTFVPHARPGMRPLDEYELMGHYDHWREDLACARDLGARAVRWGVPWYRIEPRRGQFDWGWTDQVIPHIVEELGLTPIVDLMHYGTPLWLERSFDDPAYPELVAAYAAAFAERYRGLVHCYTPLNEPLVNAEQCGREATWPPYLRGDAGLVRLQVQLAAGLAATTAALRAADPAALIVHVEATGLTVTAEERLRPRAEDEMLRRFLATDLVTGRVTPGHPLYGWLLQNGAPAAALRTLADAPVALDILGLNFYPQWSVRRLSTGRGGRAIDTAAEQDGASFGALVELYHARYGLPIMITETSAVGGDELRSRWLASSLAQVRGLRARGVPVLGYTWFPLHTMVDWAYRMGAKPVEHYHLELGMYRLQTEGPRWAPSPLVAEWRRAMADPAASVGHLAQASEPLEIPARPVAQLA